MTPESILKHEIVHTSHKLYNKGFVANHDGNISVKRGANFWATPTAQSKGDVTEQMLVLLDRQGKKVSGSHNVFSEINLHMACYAIRDDINVVIHAHPPVSTGFACAGKELEPVFIAEAIVTLGNRIPLVPFIPPRCPKTEQMLAPYLRKADVLLLQNHGVIAVGKDVAQTYYRLELVEHLATIQKNAQSIGTITPLPNSASAANLKDVVKEEVAKFLSNHVTP